MDTATRNPAPVEEIDIDKIIDIGGAVTLNDIENQYQPSYTVD